jgi:3-oxoacyl-[acyl-carrier-protein] synthase-3
MLKGNRVVISSVGAYIPKKIITNEYLETIYDTTDEWIKDRIGITKRHIADLHETTSDLGYNAAKDCLGKCGFPEVDAIILSTTSPDTLGVPTAPTIQNKLGFKNCAAYDVRSGCSGSIHALENGVAMIRSGVYEKVLVISAETVTRFIDYNDRAMPVIFGDGAGAMLLEKGADGSNGFNYSYMNCDESIYESLQVPVGGSREYFSKQAVNDRKQYWIMNGKDIYAYALRAFTDIMTKLEEKFNIKKDDIDKFIVHQANYNIIRDCFKQFDIPLTKTFVTIGELGNMASASVPICLNQALEAKFINSGDRVLLASFGAGGNYGAVSFTWK